MGGLREDELERIVGAVETIETSLEVLARKRTVARETDKQDRELQDVVERRFVKMTEAALDIGRVLLVRERGEPGETNSSTMRLLATTGVLTEATAETMAEAARFRNVLAHTYGPAINQDLVYDALQDLERYRTYVGEVRTYLDSIEAFGE